MEVSLARENFLEIKPNSGPSKFVLVPGAGNEIKSFVRSNTFPVKSTTPSCVSAKGCRLAKVQDEKSALV